MNYMVVQIWPGQTVTSLHTISPGHIWTTLYYASGMFVLLCFKYENMKTWLKNTNVCLSAIEFLAASNITCSFSQSTLAVQTMSLAPTTCWQVFSHCNTTTIRVPVCWIDLDNCIELEMFDKRLITIKKLNVNTLLIWLIAFYTYRTNFSRNLSLFLKKDLQVDGNIVINHFSLAYK
jgi:hypothetical protein